MSDADFVEYVADRLGALGGVQAVTLGGSRAQGAHTPDSDWDMAVYYRGAFDPEELRGMGWE
ncbi:nucleotidyltransferase domain-containing protein, partial [Streptomyces sp. MZ04]